MHWEFLSILPVRPLLVELQIWNGKRATGRKHPRSIQLDSDLFSRRMCANVHRCPALSLGRTLDAGATARRATLPPAIQYVCCEPARAVSSVVERLVYTQ